MTVHTFQSIAVYAELGGALRLARGARVFTTDPTTGAPVDATQGTRVAPYVDADAAGDVSFTAESWPVRLTCGATFEDVSPVEAPQTMRDAVTAAEAAQAAAEAAEAGATAPTDTIMAAKVADPASLTRAALSAGFATVVSEPLNVLRYGAVGDGTTDDTAAFASAITAWINAMAGLPGDLVLPDRRNYYLPAGIIVSPTANLLGGRIVGYGAVITADATTADALTIDTVTNNKLWRNLSIDGLTVSNAGLKLQGGGAAAALYGFTVRDFTALSMAISYGLWINGAYEGQIISPEIGMLAANTTHAGIMLDDGAGNVSSMDIFGASTKGGERGIYSASGDVNVFGGTFLESQREGIFLDNAEGCVVSGSHVENCWKSSATQVSGNAGIRATGRATISGVTAARSFNGMANAVRVFSAPHCTIIGGQGFSMLKYAFVEGSAGSSITALGLTDYAAGASYSAGGTGKLICVGLADAAAKPFALGGAASLALAAEATDATTTQTLANSLRTQLIALGLLTA